MKIGTSTVEKRLTVVRNYENGESYREIAININRTVSNVQCTAKRKRKRMCE